MTIFKAKKYAHKRVKTPEGILGFESLLEPDKMLKEEKGKDAYTVTFLFPKNDPGVQLMWEAAKEAAREEWGVDPQLWPPISPDCNDNWPFNDGDKKVIKIEGQPDKLDERYKGYYYINAKRWHTRPDIMGRVNGELVLLHSADDVYRGMGCQLSLTAFAYNNKGKRGVSFGLDNVRKTRDLERWTTRPTGEDDFADDEYDTISSGPHPSTTAPNPYGQPQGQSISEEEALARLLGPR